LNNSPRGFIDIFSRKETGFHGWAKLSSEAAILHGARHSMKPLLDTVKLRLLSTLPNIPKNSVRIQIEGSISVSSVLKYNLGITFEGGSLISIRIF